MNTDVLPEIKALRQALAQPEQEQYVTKVVSMHENGTYITERIPLPKREWQGLTGGEQDTIVRMANDSLDAICLTEAKLKEKNT